MAHISSNHVNFCITCFIDVFFHVQCKQMGIMLFLCLVNYDFKARLCKRQGELIEIMMTSLVRH